MAASVAVWGLGLASTNSMQQVRLVGAAPALASASVSLNTSVLYVGQAVGSAVGGLLYARDLVHAAGYVAAVFVALALTLVILTPPKPPQSEPPTRPPLQVTPPHFPPQELSTHAMRAPYGADRCRTMRAGRNRAAINITFSTSGMMRRRAPYDCAEPAFYWVAGEGAPANLVSAGAILTSTSLTGFSVQAWVT